MGGFWQVRSVLPTVGDARRSVNTEGEGSREELGSFMIFCSCQGNSWMLVPIMTSTDILGEGMGLETGNCS